MIDVNVLIASAIPVQPPDEWFENPNLQRATAIKVTPEGRVYGHVASWDMDHIGMPFGTRPPKNKTGYAYFRTGEILTASGQLVPVGQLTLAGGHAGLEATAAQAVRHYDDTKSAIADVSVGEDRHGIWVAGAVRSDATPDKIRALRASAPSGDWRMINGRLEMVAVCQVNVPGFPIPRSLAAGGARMSLVAAGSLPLLAQVLAEQEFAVRLERLERLVADRESEKLALVASAAKERVEKARQDSLTRAAEMTRMRIRDPKRYHELTSLLASGPSQEKRDKAADNGHALPDGSFPINTETDLRKAVQAYGRASDKVAAKKHIIKRARALGMTDALPSDWDASTKEAGLQEAAGDFDNLSPAFLSKKAKKQIRDSNGRFMEQGSFLRWKDPGGNYQYGQVLDGDLNSDGSVDVRMADTKKIVPMQPDQMQVIKAILPASQVDDQNDRGIPFKKKEGRTVSAPPPAKGPGASTPTNDPNLLEGQPISIGDHVQLADTGEDLGNVTNADDQTAIEATDPNGVVSVHDSGELTVVPSDDAPAAAPAA